MTPEQIEIAQRLVACEQWQWMAGMVPFYSKENLANRLTYTYDDDGPRKIMGLDHAQGFPSWGWPAKGSGWYPDLTDPATAGCLLAMLTDQSGGYPIVNFMRQTPSNATEWTVMAEWSETDGWDPSGEGATLGEACARALIAMWEDK